MTLDEKVPRERLKSPQNLFHMSGLMMERLVRTAAEEGVEIAEDVLIQEGKGQLRKTWLILERHMFRYGKARWKRTGGDSDLFGGNADEMEEIARRMRMLVRTRGFRYGDFAVITGDLPTYGVYARQVLGETGNSLFYRRKAFYS